MDRLNTLSAHYREFYGVGTFLSGHPAMRQAKRQQARAHLHGNKVWAASYLMMAYLDTHPLDHDLKTLEVGCGSALASIYCSKHFASRATVSDADPAVKAQLELHSQLNNTKLHWQEAQFSDFNETELAQFDTLLACDVCFWDQMTEDLAQLIDKAVNAGVSKILIADPMRPPFLALADYCITAHFAELLPIQAQTRRHHKGAILVIENN